MSTLLLTTRLLIPPPGRYLVPRPRLLERLDECLHPGCRLALISAPAGFGKTTLVSAWLHRRQPCLAAWIALDEQDNDPYLFWSYLIAALNRQDEHLGAEAQQMLDAPAPPPIETILTTLINDLARLPGGLVLVLDDYHRLHSPAVDDTLAFLLERLPPHCHVVLTTRSDPALPLALLRSRGQLLEIRPAELRFSNEEAALFLDALGLGVPPPTVDLLNRKIEGWVAGLQMTAASLSGCNDIESFVAALSGNHRYIMDYLGEEVFDRQPPGVQEFLLKTAILDTLNASLCNALLDSPTPDAQKMLAYLESANLFIVPLDNERRFYRYHQLFAEWLQKRLDLLPHEQIEELHHRASLWYEQNGLAQPAVEHAFLARDYTRAASLVDASAETIMGRGEQNRVLRWIERLPEEQRWAYLRLSIFKAAILVSNGKLRQAEQCLHEIENHPSTATTGAAMKDWLGGRVAAVYAMIAVFRGDTAAIRRYAEQSRQQLARGADSPWRPYLLLVLSDLYLADGDLAVSRQYILESIAAGKQMRQAAIVLEGLKQLVVILWRQGRLLEANQVCQEGLAYIEQIGMQDSPMSSPLILAWGLMLCEQHRLDEAEDVIRRGQALSEAGGIAWNIAWAYNVRVRLLIARGDLPAAEALSHAADRLAQEHEIPVAVSYSSVGLRALVWVRLGRLATAAQYLADHNIRAGETLDFAHLEEYRALANLLLAQGDLPRAAALLAGVLDWSAATQQHGLNAVFGVLQARLQLAQGNPRQALHTLGRALDTAAPQQYDQVFLNEGETLAGLLGEAVSCQIQPDYAAHLLAAMRSQQPAATRQPILSPRELEVLRLIAGGLANKEIAQRLCISLRTVKYHSTNIFTRLGVGNRTQAIARARDLELL